MNVIPLPGKPSKSRTLRRHVSVQVHSEVWGVYVDVPAAAPNVTAAAESLGLEKVAEIFAYNAWPWDAEAAVVAVELP